MVEWEKSKTGSDMGSAQTVIESGIVSKSERGHADIKESGACVKTCLTARVTMTEEPVAGNRTPGFVQEASGKRCSYCGGGKIMFGSNKCPKCGGSGKVTTWLRPLHSNPRQVEQYCDICKGTGEARLVRTEYKVDTCMRCLGSGTITEAIYKKYRNGNNIKVGEKKVKCKRCNGKGEIKASEPTKYYEPIY